MGGYGSGRPREKTTTVEECRTLSVRDFRGIGAFWGGLNISDELIWTNRRTGKRVFSIDYEVDTQDRAGAWIRLHHRSGCRGNTVDYHVRLTTTPMPWGGVRWYFTCPIMTGSRTCQRRCWKLYLPPGERYFGCRTCYNLTYTSSQEAHKFDEIEGMVAAGMGVPLSVLRCAMKMWKMR